MGNNKIKLTEEMTGFRICWEYGPVGVDDWWLVEVRVPVGATVIREPYKNRTNKLIPYRCWIYNRDTRKLEPDPTVTEINSARYSRQTYTYRFGKVNRPDRFDGDPSVQCTNGLYFCDTSHRAIVDWAPGHWFIWDQNNIERKRYGKQTWEPEI